MVRATILAVALAALMLARPARASDIDNWQFQAWSKFGVGSTATLEETSGGAGQPLKSTEVLKLVEKADDHLVIELTITTAIDGQQKTAAPMKNTVPAKVDSSKEMKQDGTESVTAAGKAFSCKVYEPVHPNEDEHEHSKIWESSDVPGGVVKLQVKADDFSVSEELRSYEAK